MLRGGENHRQATRTLVTFLWTPPILRTPPSSVFLSPLYLKRVVNGEGAVKRLETTSLESLCRRKDDR